MMKHAYAILMGRFLILYFCVMLFGVSILTLSNLYILGYRLEDLLLYNLGVVLAEGIMGTVLLQGITMARLRNTRKMLKGHVNTEEEDYATWREMISFPSKIFWVMVLFGIAATLLYHTGETLSNSWPLSSSDRILLVTSVLFEQMLSLTLAVLFFTGARRLLRPYILKIPAGRIHHFRKVTFTHSLLILFFCLLLITALSLFTYIFMSILHSNPPRITSLLLIFLFDLCFAAIIYLLTIQELRKDLQVLIGGMGSLREKSRAQLRTRIPIVSNDEIGSLGLIFNELQEKASKEYDEIDAELQMACSVQQKLLPEGEKAFGPFRAAGICIPCRDVGGDFYDILPLDDRRFALIIGDIVGKGMPAALLMSAALLLFRNEILQGGSPREVLQRLNKVLIGLGVHDLCLTAGVAVFDPDRRVLEYASAGHVAPYVWKESGVQLLSCSSLPLGISLEETYEQLDYAIEEDDQFIFYTDGIIDAVFDSHISGFDVFEQILLSTDRSLPIQQRLASIISGTTLSGKTGHEDDKTLVLVHYRK